MVLIFLGCVGGLLAGGLIALLAEGLHKIRIQMWLWAQKQREEFVKERNNKFNEICEKMINENRNI